MREELRECPFCGECDFITGVGAGSTRRDSTFSASIYCCKCKYEMAGGSMSDLIDKWNHRPTEDKLLKRLEQIFYSGLVHCESMGLCGDGSDCGNCELFSGMDKEIKNVR